MPDGCVWKVRLSVKEQLGAARGSFSSSGPCAKGRSTGTFLSQPGEPGCYTMDAGIPSMPKVPLKGCFDESGDLIFDSPMYNGALKFSEAGRKAALDIKSMLGSVSGNFKKLGKPPAARSGKKENKNAKSVKKSSGEIYVGGH
ncbi:MAG: hypothetical protein WCK76_08505 [Elusimicrobiota bacterium]